MFSGAIIGAFLLEELSSSPLSTVESSDQQEKKSLHVVDYIIFAAILLTSVGIGIVFAFKGKGQNTTSEYLMGRRKLRLIPVATSMFMSYISAILLLGSTAEMFKHGVQYWFSCLGGVLAALISAHLFVPMFYNLKLISSFEVSFWICYLIMLY